MYNFAALLFLALSFGALTATAAADLITSIAKAPPAATVNRRLQQDYCLCYPTTYTFQLNLNQNCDVNTIADKPGVADTSCQILSSSDVFHLVPTRIEEIQILELNRDAIVISQENIPGPFNDGYEFIYTSYSTLLPLEDQEVPKAIQLTLIGVNDVEQIDIITNIAVEYDLTNCDDEPIERVDKIGPIEVIDYTPANPITCPALQTDPPTPSPASGSMSYSASFSLSHMSKASKGKATKMS